MKRFEYKPSVVAILAAIAAWPNAATAADTVGARALLVHAKDSDAKIFYETFGFEPSPSDPYHLFLIMKDRQRRLRR